MESIYIEIKITGEGTFKGIAHSLEELAHEMFYTDNPEQFQTWEDPLIFADITQLY